MKTNETKEKSFDEVVKELGFESTSEFHKMVSQVNLLKVGLTAFRRWQYEDGSKDGLIKLASYKDVD